MTKKARRQASQVEVPQDWAEADAFVQRIGEAQREAALVQATLDESVAVAKRRAEAEAAVLSARIEALTQGLHIWAEANRAKLTRDGATKTVKMPSGEIGWRLRPLSIGLSNVKATVAALLANRSMHRFVRTKHEVDKEALLKEPEVAKGVAGVTLKGGGEEFLVTPTALPMAAGAEARVAA